ncbi:MAG TPA: hypothetical protein PLQ84_05790 [Bacteroidales bacterium]|nr:hypothetical protein [Bacteroidales bacterium]
MDSVKTKMGFCVSSQNKPHKTIGGASQAPTAVLRLRPATMLLSMVAELVAVRPQLRTSNTPLCTQSQRLAFRYL